MSEIKLTSKSTSYVTMRRCLSCWEVTEADQTKCRNCGKMFLREATDEERLYALSRFNHGN
jgi:rRNA maturation endonuclease Nob1